MMSSCELVRANELQVQSWHGHFLLDEQCFSLQPPDVKRSSMTDPSLSLPSRRRASWTEASAEVPPPFTWIVEPALIGSPALGSRTAVMVARTMYSDPIARLGVSIWTSRASTASGALAVSAVARPAR